MKYKQKYIGYLFIATFIGNILFSFIANVFFNESILTIGIFCVEISAFIISIINNNFKLFLSKKEQMIGVLFFIFQILMYFITSFSYKIYFFDIHKLIMCLGMIYTMYICCKNTVCTRLQLNIICKVVLGVGIISVVYNFFINYNYFIPFDFKTIINRGAIYNKSFYSSRAVYGTILNICAMFSLLSLKNKKNVLYWGIYFIFLINIIFTGARAQIIALFVGTLIFFIQEKKYKVPIIMISILLFLYLVITDFSIISKVMGKYGYFFDHSIYKQNADISSGRFDLWKIAFDNMNPINYLFGLGLGSKDTIMKIVGASYLEQSLFSFHSGYVDLFFEIGLFGYLIWYGIIIKVYKDVLKNCPTKIRNFLFAVLFIVLVSNIFDSCSLIFTTDTLSITSSFFIVSLPLAISNYYKNEKN